LQSVKLEVQALKDLVKTSQSRDSDARADNDEEARAKLRALEERIGSVEGGVREALELGKASAKFGGVASGAAWWNKLMSGNNNAVTIKSTDGHDVTALIGQLVNSAVSKAAKDTIANRTLHSILAARLLFRRSRPDPRNSPGGCGPAAT